MTTAAPKAHMRLSASSAHRWTKCPKSVYFAETLPAPPSSTAADWGTLAHAWLEFAVQTGEVSLADYVGAALTAVIPTADATPLTKDMCEAVDFVLDEVWARAGTNPQAVHAERSLVATSVHEECGGTADVTLVHANGDLTVIDAKFGFAVVETVDNEQLETYALAAVDAAKREGLTPPERVTVMIAQPRAPHADGRARSVMYETMDLLDARRKLRTAAKACDAGASAPCVPGAHCKYCPAAYWQKCDAFRNGALAVAVKAAKNDYDAIDANDLANPFDMSPTELGRRLAQADMLSAYLKSLEEYAYASARNGNPPAGFKLVEGRGRREWKETDAEKVARKLEALSPGADFMSRELLSVAQAEKIIGKSRFAAVKELVATKPGALALAPASDKRPAVDPSKLAEYEAVNV